MSDTPRTDKAYFAKGATMYSMAQEMKLMEKELEELQRWKAEALEGESQWDAQAVGEAIGLTLGERIHPAILPCIRRLQGELAEAQNILKQCLSIMPVGYVPTHTVENLPEMIGDLAKALAEETTEREQLERELTEARKAATHQQNGRTASTQGWALLFEEAIEQRDTLAEALRKIAGNRGESSAVSLSEAQSIADEALAAVKGGQP